MRHECREVGDTVDIGQRGMVHLPRAVTAAPTTVLVSA
jgi:hypothetical protein